MQRSRVLSRWTWAAGALVALVAMAAVYLPPRRAEAATTATFTAEADARVQESSPNTSYPTSYLRTDGGTDPRVDSYLRFSLSGLSGPVQSAKLRVYATSGSVDGPAVYGTSNTWTETGLTWANRPAHAVTASDDKGAVSGGTWVEFNVTPLVSGNGTFSFALATTSTDGVDIASRETTNKPQLVVTTDSGAADGEAPSTPANLQASATYNQVTLGWTASTDNVGVTGYEVFRNGASLTVLGAVTAYTDGSVAASTGYSYAVRARDAAGNLSPLSTSATVTTAAPPPTASATFTADADARVQQSSSNTNYGTSYLRTDGGTDPHVDTYLRFTVSGLGGPVVGAKLRLYATTGTVDGPAVYATPDNTWTETGITYANRPAHATTATDDKAAISAGAYVDYNVTALVSGNGTFSFALATSSTDGVDFYSREGTSKPQLVVTTDTTDRQAPSAPSNLAATATSSQVDLTWSPATDNVGVTGYEVLRNGTSLVVLGAVTTFSDTSVTSQTAYTYEVRARDAAGNVSTSSNGVQVTTPAPPDTQAPTAPTNLAATKTIASEVDLAWTAANDNVGVTGYEVFRNGSSLAVLGAVTSYDDTSVAPSTGYTYEVKARDAAGNVSPASSQLQVTTPISPVLANSKRLAFYYPWFPEAWTQQQVFPYTNYHPTLGYYSTDLATVKSHIASMQYGYINGGIASWWGQGHTTDQRMPTLLTAAAGTGFQWGIYYERESTGDPTVDQIRSDLTYLRDHYAGDPGYLKIGGKFLVFVYGSGTDDCSMATRWKQANTVGAFVVLKVFNGYLNCADQPDSWHQYAPASGDSVKLPFSYAISPGFWLKGEATPRLTRDLTRWQQSVQNMNASTARFHLITTFDEWGEGTSVESATEWSSPSGQGAYLDVLHNLPPS